MSGTAPGHERIPREHFHDVVVRVARNEIRARGLRATSMTAVADAAGTTRQRLYRAFPSRRDLVGAVFTERIRELADEITAAHSGPGEMIETFIDVSVAVIEGVRHDPDIQALLVAGSPLTSHEAMWLESVSERAREFFAPWFAHARSEGVLRTDMTDASLADWLQTVYASLILRTRLTIDQEREQIERYVLPSLLTPGRTGDR